MQYKSTFRFFLCAVLVAASGSLLTACDRKPSDAPTPTTRDDTIPAPGATPATPMPPANPPASSPDGTATPPRSGTGTQ